jgi:gliding motility associated protien GldN
MINTMKRLIHICLTALIMLSVISPLVAQQGVFQPGDYKDGVYDKENAVNRRYIQYTHLREGDVAWEKRVWRTIDIREKVNQPLYYPLDANVSRISIMQLMTKYIMSGQIIAFQDEEFTVPFEKSAIRDKMVVKADSVDQEQFDEQGNSFSIRVAGNVDSAWIYQNFCEIDLKEDWFFDKERSMLDKRIICITPVARFKYDSEKNRSGVEEQEEIVRYSNFIGVSPTGALEVLEDGQPSEFTEEFVELELFWLYFPQLRHVLVNYYVYNDQNDAYRMSYDDLFWKRMFSARMYKKTDQYDRSVEDYRYGVDALYEAEKFKETMRTWETDLWNY